MSKQVYGKILLLYGLHLEMLRHQLSQLLTLLLPVHKHTLLLPTARSPSPALLTALLFHLVRTRHLSLQPIV
jgi:hypothetical protein